MALAGLWEIWRSPEGDEIESCSIIVTKANELMRPIHDRMPVILAPEDWEAWLNMAPRDVHFLQELLEPYPEEEMAAWKVNTTVNNPRHDSPECVEAM